MTGFPRRRCGRGKAGGAGLERFTEPPPATWAKERAGCGFRGTVELPSESAQALPVPVREAEDSPACGLAPRRVLFAREPLNRFRTAADMVSEVCGAVKTRTRAETRKRRKQKRYKTSRAKRSKQELVVWSARRVYFPRKKLLSGLRYLAVKQGGKSPGNLHVLDLYWDRGQIVPQYFIAGNCNL